VLNQNDGDKFGAHPERDKSGATRAIPLRDAEIGVPFMWCYKAGAFLRRPTQPTLN
jgi:hypothetical protein